MISIKVVKSYFFENNFDLSKQSKFNIDVGNDLRKSKSSRFDSNDFDKNVIILIKNF